MFPLEQITAVVKIGSESYKKQFRFSPATVDILWEAIDSYTPPFYKGKALPLQQSRIKAVAIPETLTIDANDAPDLVYYWKNNNQSLQSVSGFGRNSYIFSADPLNLEQKIEVRVNDRNETSHAQNIIRIPTASFNPQILFYEINPEGRLMINKALNRFGSIAQDTIKLSFHPVFFSTTENNFTDLFVDWKLNNERVPPQNFGRQNEITISSQGQVGEAAVGMTIEGIEKLLQTDTEVLRLRFE